jgi:hypothetical protein
MAVPQNPQDQAAMIDSIAAQTMGVEPQMPPQAAPAPEPKKDSAADTAAKQGSPETEGDKMSAEAIIYEIDFGETDQEGNRKNRKLTPQQIKSTFDRYSAMNFKNAQYKPITDVIDNYMRDNPGATTKQVADQLANMAKAGESNPTMGNTEGEKSMSPDEMTASLSKWEEDNAATLPPGYKEMMTANGSGMANMQTALAETQNMLKMVLANSQGVADAAKGQVQGAQNEQINAVRGQIANNIDRVQQALGLPDSAADDFMVFAAERGFTMEDFVDPQMTVKVMQDFKNNMDGPEMERMRGIAQRRQAFTGSLGATPSPAGNAAPPADNSTFDNFASAAMSRKGIA